MSWLVLQLADSAFPSGGFVHSGGLEVLRAVGALGAESLPRLLGEVAWQLGYGSLPLVLAAHAAKRSWPELDQRCDEFLTGHVQNRASRAQGRMLLDTCLRVFGSSIEPLRAAHEREGLAFHHAPTFGMVFARLGVSADDSGRLWLYQGLRAAVSAAVRLGVIGPQAAQRLQFDLAPTLERVLAHCRELDVDELAVTCPLLEVLGGAHDRLYSRLFQS